MTPEEFDNTDWAQRLYDIIENQLCENIGKLFDAIGEEWQA